MHISRGEQAVEKGRIEKITKKAKKPLHFL